MTSGSAGAWSSWAWSSPGSTMSISPLTTVPTVVFTDGSPEQPAEPAEVEPPKRAALKEQWVTYAVHRGMPQEEAEAMTRAELIEKFGQA
jgi:hypothetical protein